MGLLSSIRKASISTSSDSSDRAKSISNFEYRRYNSEEVDLLSEEQRRGRQREKEAFANMSDKEKLKWMDHYAMPKAWKSQDGAAGLYGGEKCC